MVAMKWWLYIWSGIKILTRCHEFVVNCMLNNLIIIFFSNNSHTQLSRIDNFMNFFFLSRIGNLNYDLFG